MNDDWKRRLERVGAELRHRDDPVALVREMDALDASARYPYVWPRGPVFGVAVLGPEAGARWRLVTEVTDGTPQEARDALNSLLWFKAKDDAGTVTQRRELLAAVRLLECERINELTVLGTRYRIVRGDEFVRCGLLDGPEPPRRSDPETVEPVQIRPRLDENGVIQCEPGSDSTRDGEGPTEDNHGEHRHRTDP